MVELYSSHDIDIKTKILAKKISDEHRGDKTPIVMVGVLNGAFMFFADLVKNIDVDVECDFIRVKSYTNKERGDVQFVKDVETSLKGKHVYIVDDIFDTGYTMKYITDFFHIKNPKSVNIVTLVKRKENGWDPTLYKRDWPFVHSFYYAFECDNEWLVGYGLDTQGGYQRNLKSIFAL
jgi:hypoxanthine phosphoribosyltransferase